MCACHDPEHESNYSVDQYPNDVTIFAEHEKENDLDDTFGDETGTTVSTSLGVNCSAKEGIWSFGSRNP